MTLLELVVVRLQVQLDHMKPGVPPRRIYQPSILREVAELRVTPDGVIGVESDGTEHLDVHHRKHPRSRDAKGGNGISVMATGDYEQLRARYGEHLTDGIAGESILVDHRPGLAGRSMPDEVSLLPEGLTLAGVHVAKPCVEFTRFCLRRTDFEVDDAVRETLKALDSGARGYKMSAAHDGAIRVGDILRIQSPG